MATSSLRASRRPQGPHSRRRSRPLWRRPSGHRGTRQWTRAWRRSSQRCRRASRPHSRGASSLPSNRLARTCSSRSTRPSSGACASVPRPRSAQSASATPSQSSTRQLCSAQRPSRAFRPQPLLVCPLRGTHIPRRHSPLGGGSRPRSRRGCARRSLFWSGTRAMRKPSQRCCRSRTSSLWCGCASLWKTHVSSSAHVPLPSPLPSSSPSCSSLAMTCLQMRRSRSRG
mmetsp:Transcript_35837/g.88190  ORF Transcript_35837/g.88190 Transcript_35837/m.88190 type:complete len:228 (+) Transcript_35837:449-1132(+)